MKIDTITIEENDVVMIHHCIGNIPPEEVDKYMKKIMKELDGIFGTKKLAVFPVREGPTWDFTVIKRPFPKKLK